MIKHSDHLREIMKAYSNKSFLDSRIDEIIEFQKINYNNRWHEDINSFKNMVNRSNDVNTINVMIENKWNNLFIGKDISTKEKIFEIMSSEEVCKLQIFIQMIYYDRIGEAAHIINHLETLKPSMIDLNILDFGCGVADYSLAFNCLEMTNHIVLCDIPGPILDFAHWRYKNRILPSYLLVEKDDYLKDKRNNERYDVIIAAEVLEHLHDPCWYIKRFSEMLRDDGHLYVSGYPMREKKLIGDHVKEAYDIRLEALSLFRDNFMVCKDNVKLYKKVVI